MKIHLSPGEIKALRAIKYCLNIAPKIRNAKHEATVYPGHGIRLKTLESLERKGLVCTRRLSREVETGRGLFGRDGVQRQRGLEVRAELTEKGVFALKQGDKWYFCK